MSDESLCERTVKENSVYSGRIIRVRNDDILLPNGKPAQREVVAHNGGVCVAALTAENELLFVRQFRYPYGEILLELPAGKLEAGEDPREAGRRELAEETGAVAESFEDLGLFYPTPGYCGEKIYTYFAQGLTFRAQRLDEDEFLQCVKIPLTEAVHMILRGEIRDGKTQAAVLKLAVKKI